MAEPRWCLDVEIQNTTDDVTAAPLPRTVGIVDVIQRGVVPARAAKTHVLYYARDEASDLGGFFRLDEANVDNPVVKTTCAGLPPAGAWVETDPIDFITDFNAVTGIKSNDALTVRVQARWGKYDTVLNPLHRQLRVELVRRRDNSPNPPDFVVLDSHTFSISTALTVYTADLTLDTWWASNHRYLLRLVGRFKRADVVPPP